MKRLSVVLFVLLCLGIGGYIVLVPRNANVSATNQAFIEEKSQKIENELAHLCEIDNFHDHPWAGWYYVGDGLGSNINLLGYRLCAT